MKKRSLKSDTSGTTMVEVLVAFSLLMIGIMMFTQLIQFSENMYNKATQLLQQQEIFNEEYYGNAAVPEDVDGQNFSLEINTEKSTSSNISESDKNVKIALPGIKLQQYENPDRGIKLYNFAEK